MKQTGKSVSYKTPKTEVVELRTNVILCQSPDGEGGGNQGYGEGGEA